MQYLFLVLVFFGSVQMAYAQEIITVNETTPCFLNYTAGADLWNNCGFDTDYLAATILPFEYVTGGLFSMIIVSVLIGAVYMKYQKAIYPILIGVMFLPMSFFLFPETFVIWAVLMAFLAMGILVWYVFVRQTKEF